MGSIYDRYFKQTGWVKHHSFDSQRDITIPAGTLIRNVLKVKKDFTVHLEWMESKRTEHNEVIKYWGIEAINFADDKYFGYQNISDEDVIFNYIAEIYDSKDVYADERKKFADLIEVLPICQVAYETTKFRVYHYFSGDQTLTSLFDQLRADNDLELNHGENNSPGKMLKEIIEAQYEMLIDGGFDRRCDKIPQKFTDAMMEAKVQWLVEEFCEPYTTSYHLPTYYSSFLHPRRIAKHAEVAKHLAAHGIEVPSDVEYAKHKREAEKAAQERYEKQAAEDAANELKKRNSYKGKWYLARYSDNWADEMDFTVQSVMKESERKNFLAACKKLGDESISFSIGTNEDMELTGNDIANAVEWIEIPDATTREFLLEHAQVDEPTSIESLWEHVAEALDEGDGDEEFDDEDED